VVLNDSVTVLRRRSREQKALTLHACSTAWAEQPDERRDLRQSVIDALAELPEPTRTIVALRLMEGWSGNQVKDLLGSSASEVSRRLHDGMEQLRGLLAEYRPL
jgi:RNA polymerase sigma factor (sigma-70 family)